MQSHQSAEEEGLGTHADVSWLVSVPSSPVEVICSQMSKWEEKGLPAYLVSERRSEKAFCRSPVSGKICFLAVMR